MNLQYHILIVLLILLSIRIQAQEMTQYSGKLVDSQGKEANCSLSLNGSLSGNIGQLTFENIQGVAILEGQKTKEAEGSVVFEGLLNINGIKTIEFGLVLGGRTILAVALKQNGQTFSYGVLSTNGDVVVSGTKSNESQICDPLLIGFWGGESDANSTRSKYIFTFADGGLMNCMKSEFWASGYSGGSTSFNSQSQMKQEPWVTQIINEGGRWYSKNGEIWIKTPHKPDYQLFRYQSNGYELILQADNFFLRCTKMQF